MRNVICALLLLAAAMPAAAQEQAGTVSLPLTQYQNLTQGSSSDHGAPQYAFSDAHVEVAIGPTGSGARAEVTISADVETFNEGWTLVPLAAAGAIHDAQVGSNTAPLVERSGVVSVALEGRETRSLSWSYYVDATRYDGALALALPTPMAGAALEATFSDMQVSPVVVPASGVTSNVNGSNTTLSASLPASGGVQISWPSEEGGNYTLSRATYRGTVVGDSIRWTAELGAELEGSNRAMVPLFPSSVALESVSIDRVDAAISVRDDRFAVPLRGRGRHRIVATFLVPIVRDDGLPHVELDIAATPVSRFELTLPGNREVSVTPMAGVSSTVRGSETLASFNVPMTSHVSVRWAEAVPDAGEVLTRANASIVHIVQPDEGVLSIRALVTYDISRGKMKQATLRLPQGVQVNSVESAAGVVNDWRVTDQGGRRLNVFLDREVEGELALDIRYECSWPVATRTQDAFTVPMLRALEADGVTRQRGMVALLAIRELTLEPRDSANVTPVGDNALPPEVRDELSATVAHTYRYLDEEPQLTAIGAIREPEPARFEVQVDTLVSLGDVSTTLATRVDVDVKSGSLTELSLRIPEGLSLLEVSAPSLRRYEMSDDRRLRIELTQPMEGRFTIEVLSDRVTGQEEELSIPLLGVHDAEVERGRVGVEALAPFQVDMASADGLSPIDSRELPEPLLLRTDNPILHAYRYAQAEEAPRLAVRITRHGEIQTANASVEEAHYKMLYTREGVAVTNARWVVRNRRQQFLRVTLPEGSEVWSATVDGRIQAPALEAGSGDEPTILLNIVSAADAFTVELVYATDVSELGSFGRLHAQLPMLDIVAAHTTWEIIVPSGVTYSDPDTQMTFVEGGYDARYDGLDGLEEPRDPMNVGGVRYVFEQMYGSTEGPSEISIAYLTGWSGIAAKSLSGLGALLLWLGFIALIMLRFGVGLPAEMRARIPLPTYRTQQEGVAPPRYRVPPLAKVLSVAVAGALLLFLTIGYLSVPATAAAIVSATVWLALLGVAARRHLPKRRKPTETAPSQPQSRRPHHRPPPPPNPKQGVKGWARR